MTVNFRNSAGTDFDSIFAPNQSGTYAVNCGLLNSSGVDLSQLYEVASYGTKAGDVAYRTSDGSDVSNLWAAYGTAVYFPSAIMSSSVTTAGVSRTASITITIKTDGTITVGTVGTSNSSGSGVYRYADSSAAYDFRISGASVYGNRASSSSSSTITGKGSVSVAYPNVPGNSQAFDTGWIAAADDANAFVTFTTSVAANAGVSHIGGAGAGGISIQIRRKTDSVVISTWNTNVSCTADSQS